MSFFDAVLWLDRLVGVLTVGKLLWEQPVIWWKVLLLSLDELRCQPVSVGVQN